MQTATQTAKKIHSRPDGSPGATTRKARAASRTRRRGERGSTRKAWDAAIRPDWG